MVISSGSLNYIKYFPTSVFTLFFAFPYGIAGLLLYFTVKAMNKKKITSNLILKIIACVIVIDLVELLAGLSAVKIVGVMPWDYSDHLLNFMGLISLPITIR